jgi:protein-S-isoprenylcysteine O-methyltransferase Ste14
VRRAALGSVLFLLAAPGVVAGLIPWSMTDWRTEGSPFWGSRALGGILIAAGVAVLVHAFARFVLEGVGTPAPIAPTERLVIGGIYRHVRNPMYLAVGATIVGQALLLGKTGLFVYALVFAAIVFVRSPLRGADPAHRFGAQYDAYRRAVPAWWPRLRP